MTEAAAAETVDTRPTKIMYVAEATAHGGRDGFVTSQDGQIKLKVAMPPAMGGDGNGTNRNSSSRPATAPASTTR